ncbi:MAG: FAD-binding oxidoreductase [Candidatus Saccharibacteria bacterium]
MNKITKYLNEHILGEVTSNKSVLDYFSRDGSPLKIKPELVVSPRTTNDIRKIARFTWQLAEKNHVMPVTVRGSGTDKTGASIGKGIIINTIAHLNKIIFVSLKNKNQFIHIQPGMTIGVLNEILKSHTMIIPKTSDLNSYSTIGGAIANNANSIGESVTRMELILANGDIIETSRISRHELSKKKGMQTFEGELYRKIDGIIDDNNQLIASATANNKLGNVGYSGISKVKQKDGSFDLTPLITGSQGTLGIISEAVINTEFFNPEESVIVIPFEDAIKAHEAANIILSYKPTILNVIDGRIFNMAENMGKHYLFSNEMNNLGAVIYASFNDFSEGARKRKLKHAIKKIKKLNIDIKTYNNSDHSIEELNAINEVSSVILQPEADDESLPPLIDGATVPSSRIEEFIVELNELALKHHIELPTQIDWIKNIIDTRVSLQLHNVSDKQKVFKLINDYAELVNKFDGNLAASSGEGRIKAPAIYSQIDPELIEIFKQIREAFDPFGTMNPGVKQTSDLKTLISYLDPDFNLATISKHSPKI